MIVWLSFLPSILVQKHGVSPLKISVSTDGLVKNAPVEFRKVELLDLSDKFK